MADPEEPRSTEGFRRLLAFTDAVVAIALTLLVLPLTDVATETSRSSHGITVWKFLGDNQNALINFAISFIVIAVMWRDHHRVTERYALYDQTIVQLSMVWMATVVLMPFATILNDNQALKWGNSFYVLILLISVAALVAIRHHGTRHPELLSDEARGQRSSQSGYGTLLVLAVVLVITIIWPSVGAWPLLGLFLVDPLERTLTRWRDR